MKTSFKIMTKNAFFVLFFLFFFIGCSNKNIQKDHIAAEKKTISFSKYLTAAGTGKTLLAAKMQAKAEIGNIFKSQIVSSLRTRAESVTSNSGEQSFSRTIESDIKIASSTSVRGLEILDTHFDKKTDTYYATAGLDRHKTKSILDKELNELDSKIESLLKVEAASDMLRLLNLKKASKLWVQREAISVKLKILGFSGTGFVNYEIKDLFDEFIRIHSKIRLYIRAKGEKSDIVKEYIAQAFSKKGFVLTDYEQDANAFIDVKTSITKIEIKREDNVKFARSKVWLSIRDIFGNTIVDLVKKKRGAHKDYNEAVYAAIKKCSQAIGEQGAGLIE